MTRVRGYRRESVAGPFHDRATARSRAAELTTLLDTHPQHTDHDLADYCQQQGWPTWTNGFRAAPVGPPNPLHPRRRQWQVLATSNRGR